ncbi:hypothetical protein GJ744_011514 [Endocarpon pusillum]|uniref:Uncharacterized protein n=1 Tax=Endocarpon pusillum TaxID=364733 RepID=A0A8H7ACP8_9EURO|nr:hypothetical protein GJ744_011514 [Endocarpon pusillum]
MPGGFRSPRNETAVLAIMSAVDIQRQRQRNVATQRKSSSASRNATTWPLNVNG